MDLNIAGKRALVSGSSRGIGQAIAISLAEAGASVAVVARSETDVDALTKRLNQISDGNYGLACDLLQDGAAAKVTAALNDAFGNPDILVHNLGGTLDVTDPFAPIEDWRRVMRFNFDVAVEFNNLLVPYMTERKWGRIVNISSVAAVELNGPASYAAAKAALCAYTRSVGRLLAADGVIMSAVLPGVVETEGGYWEEMKQSDPDRVANYLRDRCPLGRFGTPREIADFVAFLCAEQASFNPGAVYPLDGGQLRGYAF